MGIYINPKDDKNAREKGEKINKVGIIVTPGQFAAHKPGDKGLWGVAVIDNVMFVAAGVAYSPSEAQVFATADGRDKVLYLVSVESIRELDPACAEQLDKIHA